MDNNLITLCIIEDISEIRKGLEFIIQSDSRLELLGSYENAEDALEAIPLLCPDVVMTDINLPGKSGIEVITLLKEVLSETQFIVLTVYEDNDLIFEALKAGAGGYILKNTSASKILESIFELYEGGSPMSPIIAKKVITAFTQKNQSHDPSVNQILSKREMEVLELLSKGYLYKEIADKLFITLSTVKRHLNHIYVKLHVQNKTEALNKFYGRI